MCRGRRCWLGCVRERAILRVCAASNSVFGMTRATRGIRQGGTVYAAMARLVAGAFAAAFGFLALGMTQVGGQTIPKSLQEGDPTSLSSSAGTTERSALSAAPLTVATCV
jgi:hypothetical protein